MSVLTVRETAWISIIPQLLFMGLLMAIYYLLNFEDFILFGAVTYFVVSKALLFFIAKDHRLGMESMKKGDFEGAISGFQKSYDFFSKYPWIDKYRYLTLLSSSKFSYREMALNNIAFGYGQMGNGDKAIETYHQMLAEFPESKMAKTALNLINAVREEE